MNESAQAVVTCELRDLGGSQAWHTVLPAARRALSPYSTCARCYMQESRALSLESYDLLAVPYLYAAPWSALAACILL